MSDLPDIKEAIIEYGKACIGRGAALQKNDMKEFKKQLNRAMDAYKSAIHTHESIMEQKLQEQRKELLSNIRMEVERATTNFSEHGTSQHEAIKLNALYNILKELGKE